MPVCVKGIAYPKRKDRVALSLYPSYPSMSS